MDGMEKARNPDVASVAERLKDSLEKSGLSYRGAAKVIGIDFHTIYNIIKGRTSVRINNGTLALINAFIAEVERSARSMRDGND